MLVKESSGFVRVTVVRRRGASGEVGVKWRSIDRSAISGRDYKGGSGELVFKHYEVSLVWYIDTAQYCGLCTREKLLIQ